MTFLIYLSVFASISLTIYILSTFRLPKLKEKDRNTNMGDIFLLKVLKSPILTIAYFLQKTGEEKINRRYAKKLIVSGNKMNLLPIEFVALKWLSSLLGGGIAFYMVLTLKINIMSVAILGLMMHFYPDLWLHETTNKRKRRIAEDLPYTMDLLALSVEAGLSFKGAIEKVVEQGYRGPLRDELEKMLQSLRLGLDKAEALSALAKRTDLYIIQSFTSALIQAEKLGTPIGKALRMQSDLRRTERFNQLEKLAQEAPVKMLMPLLFFILPSVFIVILGPMWLKFIAEGI